MKRSGKKIDTLGNFKSVHERFLQGENEETRTELMYPERTVRKLKRTVFQVTRRMQTAQRSIGPGKGECRR